MAVIDPKAIERVSGPSWESVRPIFVEIAEALLEVAPNTGSQLTTIYVKFTIGQEPRSPVFAVVWIKTAKRLVIGFALPDEFECQLLSQAPAGMTYKGLTRYLTIEQGDDVPKMLRAWARAAYEHVSGQQSTI